MHFVHPAVAADQPKRRSRGRKTIACAVIDALECRVMLSVGTLTPVATFNGVNGEAPVAVVEDATGNLFGITSYTQQSNGDTGSGVVFEVPAGTGTIQDLASFGSSTIVEGGSLIIDSSGNLFGTTTGLNSILFEVAQGSTSLTTLASQNLGAVRAVDSSGDLFGTDVSGNMWELARGSSTETDNVFPSAPAVAYPVLGADGNFYGIGGSSIIEISPGTGMATTLAPFDTTTIGNTPTGIAVDSSGDIYGFCEYGGPAGPAPGNGTVWELPAGASTVSLVAAFDSTTGTNPICPPVLGVSGNLYGLTQEAGANGSGTFFGIGAGSTSITDLADLPADLPSTPNAGIVADSAGVTPDTAASPAGSSSPRRIIDVGGGQYGPDVFDALFGNDSVSASGGIDKLTTTTTTMPLDPIDDYLKKEARESELNDLSDKLNEFKNIAMDVLSGVSPFYLHGESVESGLSGQISQIESILATTKHELNATNGLLNKETRYDDQYNNEVTAITKLNSELTAQPTNPAAQAKIQKKITADDAVEAKLLTEATNSTTATETQLTDIGTLEDNISAAITALPTPTAGLSATITSLPASVAAGKHASAVVMVTNTGNTPTTISFQVAITARPAEPTGADLIPIATVTMKLVRLKPASPKAMRLSFVIPSGLPAGTYTLELEPDANAAFTGTPTPVVSTATFTVT